MSDKSNFRIGYKLRWIGDVYADETDLKHGLPVIVLKEPSINFDDICVQQGEICSWRPRSEFELWDKPESSTNAPDAAAELAKITKLLDHCQFPCHGSTYSRVKDVLCKYVKCQADTWKEMLEQLEAIK